MDSLTTTLLTFMCCFCGYIGGQSLSRFLPDHHYQQSDARDVLKSATGMIATLVALVLGLLVSSSKSTFDHTSDAINGAGAKLVQIDRMLHKFGPDALPAQQNMRNIIEEVVERMDRPDITLDEQLKQAKHPKDALEERIAGPILALEPTSDPQRKIQQRVLELLANIADARWLLVERATNKLPVAFLILLYFWLATLFAGFGILSPRNITVHTAFAICALSMTGAVYLIMEMNEPLTGTVRVSSRPLRFAISVMTDRDS